MYSSVVFTFSVAFLAELASSAPLTAVVNGLGLDAAVQPDLVLVRQSGAAAATASMRSQQPRQPKSLDQYRDVPVGEALDLFYRFGFFSLSVRVVPRDDPGKWVIREPTARVFAEGSLSKSIRAVDAPAFNDDLEVYLCDDESELERAFFSSFAAEGIEQPHKLYTGSWHSSTKAKYFGLEKEHFDGESAFVLLRMRRPEAVVEAAGGRLRPEIEAEGQKLTIGDERAVMDFIKRFGTHYIQRVELGESVYQVYALSPESYAAAKRSLLSSRSASPMDLLHFREQHLQPWNVRGVGRPLAASGDRGVLAFLEGKNLIDVAADPSARFGLEEAVAASTSTSVLGLGFASLRSHAIRDPVAREYYDGVLGTNAALWGSNI